MKQWQRGLLWGGAVIGAIVVALIGLVMLQSHRADQDALANERATRARRKVHLGDDPKTVRLRLGIPDTSVSEPTDSAMVWFYKTSTDPKGVFDDPNVIAFSTVGGAPIVKTIFFSAKPFKEPWVPEDSLLPNQYSDADQVLDDFRKRLGEPCDIRWYNDSTSVFYAFRLSTAEKDEDSVYLRASASSSAQQPYRFVEVNLRSGKRVTYHGWTKSKEASSCASKQPR
jgi:hypothetical protein